MINDITAHKIASNWHGGQWSPLYSFAFTGIYFTHSHLEYLQEIETCLHPEYALHPSTLSNKDAKDLTNLKEYFIQAGIINCIVTEYHEHPIYGYLIPFIKSAPDNILENMNAIHYAV